MPHIPMLTRVVTTGYVKLFENAHKPEILSNGKLMISIGSFNKNGFVVGYKNKFEGFS